MEEAKESTPTTNKATMGNNTSNSGNDDKSLAISTTTSSDDMKAKVNNNDSDSLSKKQPSQEQQTNAKNEIDVDSKTTTVTDENKAQKSETNSANSQAQATTAITTSTTNTTIATTTTSAPQPSTTVTTISACNDLKSSSSSRKQPAASNKGANASNATPKPKRTKKVKQNAENTSKTKPATVPSTQPLPTISTSTLDSKKTTNPQQSPTAPPTKKRKPRATAANSAPTAPANQPAPLTVSPPKRTRKKKGDPVVIKTDSNNNPPPMAATSITIPPISVANPQLLSVTSNVPLGSSPMMSNVPMLPSQQPNINRHMPGISPLDAHDPANRYYSLTVSPYANYDYGNAASLTRPSLSRLFTSSSAEIGHSSSHSDELSKAFEDLRDNSWSHLSKCILEQAQQFDIPSLIGTLYTLRSENDKLTNKVRDLAQKRDQLIAMNARLELPGSSLISHLNHTSPNFSAVVAGLTNSSPKSLPISSPSPAMNKSPIVPGGPYNHFPPTNSLGPPDFVDRSSPLIGLQTPHSGVNSLKSSTISTPSPPTGALMAHGANNRANLMTVNNLPYVSNVHPTMNALNPLGGPNPPSSSYCPRQ